MIDPKLFPEPGLALVAVSGGPDSVALLRLMHRQAGDLGLTLAIAHVNHGIHPDSTAWAEGVRAIGAALHVPVHAVELGLGQGTAETAARAARYEALERLRVSLGARYVVTAHHADDQVETVLFRILRGSAPPGLAAMAPVRGSLVRPLLEHHRDQLAPWAEGSIQDPANVSPSHDRSWIRTVLLPLLRDRWGDRVDERLRQLGRHAAEDRRAWEQVADLVPGLRATTADGVVTVRRKPLAGLPPAVAHAMLRGLTRRAGLVLRPRHAARLVRFAASEEGGRRLELGGHLEATLQNGVLTVGRVATSPRVHGSP